MRIRAIFLPVLLLLAYGSSALAQPISNWYAGGSLGRGHAKFQTSDFSFNNAGVSESTNERDQAYKLLLGYRFGKYLAAELSYARLGTFAYKYDSTTGAGSGKLDYKVTATGLSGVATIPLSRGFSVLGRLGVDYNHVRRSGLIGNFTPPTAITVPSADKRKWSGLLGVGGQWDFSDRLGVRLEYENYGKVGSAATTTFNEAGQAKISMWSIGLIGSF